MSLEQAVAGGRGGARWWRGLPGRLPGPTGIRNGGLLLVLVALAALMTFVDRPPESGQGRRLPGIFQHLSPPAGISQLPPEVAQPPATAGPAGADELAALTGAGAGAGGLERSDRGHPRRVHPRPARDSGAVGSAAGGGGGSTGSGGSGSGPVDVAPSVRVQVPSVTARVTPPRVLAREVPAAEAKTPAVRAEVSKTPAVGADVSPSRLQRVAVPSAVRTGS